MRVSTSLILGLAALSSAQKPVTKNTLERACDEFNYYVYCCDNPYYPPLPSNTGEDSYQRPFYNCTFPKQDTNVSACSLKRDCPRVPVCGDYSEIDRRDDDDFRTGFLLTQVLEDIGHKDWAYCQED